jgi:ribosome-binding factor A
MNYTLARQLDNVRAIATTCILDYIEMHDHLYGIITVTHVDIPKDQRYMDIYLTSTYQPE